MHIAILVLPIYNEIYVKKVEKTSKIMLTLYDESGIMSEVKKVEYPLSPGTIG